MNLANFTYFYRLPPSASETQLTELYPSGADLPFTVSKDDYRYTVELTGDFIAQGTSYDALEALRSSDVCDEVELVLKLDGSEVWYGQLNLKKCEWQPFLRQVRVSADTITERNCLIEDWENEENILGFSPAVEVKTFYGTLTEETCGPINNGGPIELTGFFEINVSGCLADIDAYAYKRLYIEEVSSTSYDHYAVWVTEQATVACSGGVPVSPPGDGWVLLSDDCAGSGTATWGRRPQTVFTGEVSATSGKYWDQRYEVVGGDVATYGNGRLLSTILTQLTSGCSLTVKSDFFGINAPGTAPSNSAYTAASSLQSIVVYQKSDIKLPNADTPATLAYLKLKDLLDWLATMFAAYWRLEDSGATLRLEHISYFSGSNGDDLTATHPPYVENRNNFSYDTDKLVPRDTFTWMDETTDGDFRGVDIIYPLGCADKSQSARPNRPDQVFTDIGTVVNSPSTVADTGFFFIATDEISGSYYLNRETGELSNTIKPNAALSWANLHENFLSWNRPTSSGNLNRQDVTFNDYERSKRQEAISIPMDPSTFFAKDFSERFNTELGWGEVDTAEYSAKSRILVLNLLHED